MCSDFPNRLSKKNMVSFSCDNCQETIKKPKLKQHSYRCSNSFTCIDCSKSFPAVNTHTSCMEEHEKYQKHIYGKAAPANTDSVPKEPVPIATNEKLPTENVSKKSKASFISQLKLKKELQQLKKPKSLLSLRKNLDQETFDLILKKIKIGRDFLD